MLIDSNAILWEDKKTAIATGNGNPVGLTSLHNPGRAEAVNISLRLQEDLAGATSVALKLQESDAKDGTFTDVAGMALTLPAAEFKRGAKTPWRFLPKSVNKQWLRLAVTVTGTATTGKMFCAIVREDDQPYEPGLYLNAGKEHSATV